jgi:hypothetical protein
LFTVKVKLLDPSEPSALTVSSVVKANDSAPELLSVAAQFPLILLAVCEFEPHPASRRPNTPNTATATFFIRKNSSFSWSREMTFVPIGDVSVILFDGIQRLKRHKAKKVSDVLFRFDSERTVF